MLEGGWWWGWGRGVTEAEPIPAGLHRMGHLEWAGLMLQQPPPPPFPSTLGSLASFAAALLRNHSGAAGGGRWLGGGGDGGVGPIFQTLCSSCHFRGRMTSDLCSSSSFSQSPSVRSTAAVQK